MKGKELHPFVLAGLLTTALSKRQVILQKERMRVDAAGNPEEAASKPRYERENLTGSVRDRPVVAATSAEPTSFT
jgi:hypothetical protein